jgi:diguanylate cyclase (GGDEF)-like protein/PAS domain S-box-containing protein
MTRPAAITILIIDDGATNRRIYAQLSQKLELDVTVRTFGHPQDALDWLDHNSADLIITDYKMPGMTGNELVARVRARADDPDIPIIVVTAYDDRQFRVTSLEAGATDFLLSPVDHIEFVTRARNLLKLRMQQRILMHRADLLERRLEVSLTAQEELLRESRESLAQVIDTVPAMISATDRFGKCVFVNALFAQSVGMRPADLVGKPVELFFGPERAASNRRLDRLVIETGEPVPTREEEVLTGSGEARVYLTSKVPLRGGRGETLCVLTTSVDITERRIAERRLQHMANHDPLTGLPSRTMMRERMRRELARGRRGDHQFAVHFVDLDRFKAINDADGHHGGDEVLRRVAEALADLASDGIMVARIGGDEFAVLQPEVNAQSDAAALAQTILARLNSLSEEASGLGVRASIGITLSPRDSTEPDELLKNADQAMYVAKRNGGNSWCFFAAEMRPRVSHVVQLEAELRGALGRGEFLLHYQPQIDLHSGTIAGAEALLRWHRPGAGLVPPDHFLGLAEETGLIVPINEWVLHEACRQAQAWRAAGLGPLRISVNLSPIQFRRRSVREAVAAAIASSGIDPHTLDLELTEGILLGDAEDVVAQLHSLRALGVGLSLDDFGTGYSSLSYIRKFPLDRLKIDRSFIQGIGINQSDLAIVRTIIDLGHILRLRVLAEGVETKAQLALLQAEGCDEVQGFHFSQPVPADRFVNLLAEFGQAAPLAAPEPVRP